MRTTLTDFFAQRLSTVQSESPGKVFPAKTPVIRSTSRKLRGTLRARSLILRLCFNFDTPEKKPALARIHMQTLFIYLDRGCVDSGCQEGLGSLCSVDPRSPRFA